MIHKNLLVLLLVMTGMACRAQNVVVRSHDSHIRYSGRVVMLDEAAELSWSASSVKINFKGTGLKATLKDEHAGNYLNVIVDGKVMNVIQPDSVQKEYTLVSGLPDANHTLELFKRTEWVMGKVWFYQFALDKSGAVLPPSPSAKRKIEFYGDSITCGMADEDSTGKDRGTGQFENGYVSYASIVARHYDAELFSVSRSGIGMLVSWFPMVMPDMWYRLDPSDAESKWDFSKYTPNLVVINIFQNDVWITKLPDNDQFKAKFGAKAPTDDQIIKTYKEFVKNIRGKYPKAQIICVLGNMDAVKEGSLWPGYVQKAVTEIGDKNIYTHIFPYKNTPGHPNKKEHQAMADDLVAFIDQHIKW